MKAKFSILISNQTRRTDKARPHLTSCDCSEADGTHTLKQISKIKKFC